ncbi:MAG: tyrosine--tRNA ligase [Herpetosiphonaceae bacterium]|nr:tyrosine--tRNA ligase [Herpetosiphonaceae bacterium]
MELETVLTRGVAEIIVERELREKLAAGKPLRLKQGFDPSRSQLTIGNAVGLRKLRQFQELGHQVVLIVGDWTAQIGDPSGKDETRPRLDASKVKENAQTFMEQFFRIVDRERTEVRWQSEWFGDFTLEDAFNLAGRFTLAQMLAHETFRKRYEAGGALTMLELMYPMLQAYDSVAINADVEFGGMDQKFNILAGRELMASLGMMPQQIVLVPLIPGTDGSLKMGKSLGNSIDMLMPPAEMYGKVMSIGDAVMPVYFETLTDEPVDEVRAALGNDGNPRDLKMRLARLIVSEFLGPDAAQEGEAAFIRVFQQRNLPMEMPQYVLSRPIGLIDLLVGSGLASSKTDARRQIDAGAVRLDGEKVATAEIILAGAGQVLQVGKRRFVRLVSTA